MLLLRGATRTGSTDGRTRTSFNTCSSCEEQLSPRCVPSSTPCFNTCSSCEEQLPILPIPFQKYSFNTCSSCEEQLSFCAFPDCSGNCFNTCSSCEEQLVLSQTLSLLTVSIHAPLARSNLAPPMLRRKLRFQYMLLLRGATIDRKIKDSTVPVSIHAPLARSNANLMFATF